MVDTKTTSSKGFFKAMTISVFPANNVKLVLSGLLATVQDMNILLDTVCPNDMATISQLQQIICDRLGKLNVVLRDIESFEVEILSPDINEQIGRRP